MSTIINADTSNGLKFTSDTSGEIKLQSAGTDIATVSSTGIAMASGKSLTGGGKILQVVQDTKLDTFTTTSSSFTDITGLSVSITPSATSSKILVMLNLNICGNQGATIGFVNLLRGSTEIYKGDAYLAQIRASYGVTTPDDDQTPYSTSATFLDSPSSTSALTYKVQTKNQGSGTIFVNRGQTNPDSASYVRCASSITVMEVAG